MGNPPDNLEIRRASLEEIIGLRHDVLCAGQPWSEAQFGGDHNATTRHFGAFVDEGDGGGAVNVGCVSYMQAARDGREAWQLRGMATAPDWIGRGVGSQLVAVAHEQLLAEFPIRLFWCRARVPAIGFYEKLGWRVTSDEYVVGVYGPHRDMVWLG